MKGTSKVIMGATLVMVLSLAIVLGLVLVLLAELYCSLLLRRRQLKLSKSSNAASPSHNTGAPSAGEPQYPSPLSSFYAQGVLHAPRSFLFPRLSTTRDRDDDITAADDVERQHAKLHEFLSVQTALESAITSPKAVGDEVSSSHNDAGKMQEQLVYICNPIYENGGSEEHTPFETPEMSPESEVKTTPPLTPIKDLAAKACSVTVRDARTSGSESNSQNVAFSPSCSGSPSTCSW